MESLGCARGEKRENLLLHFQKQLPRANRPRKGQPRPCPPTSRRSESSDGRWAGALSCDCHPRRRGADARDAASSRASCQEGGWLRLAPSGS